MTYIARTTVRVRRGSRHIDNAKKITTLEVEQGPAFDVALLAAVSDGAYPNIEAACKATIKVAAETKLVATAVKTYNKLFPIYQDLYVKLADNLSKLAMLG